MPELARRYEERYYYYGDTQKTCTAIPNRRYTNTQFTTIKPQRNIQPARPNVRRKPQKQDRNVLLARVLGLVILVAFGLFVLPAAFKNISSSIFTKSPYPNIKADYQKIVTPTVRYLNNNLFMNTLSLNASVSGKKAGMMKLPQGAELTDLESSIKNIMPLFPSIHPAVYVWDYDTGNYANINGNEVFSAASIIKVPVLLQLFKSIERGQVHLYDQIPLTEYFRSEGSGSLQFKAENSMYTVDTLARLMITESDNSATNMLMSKIGSMVNVNQGIRDWGLKQTQVRTWLPDLTGNNYTTAEDMATMLYNIDNPKFLSEGSRNKIIDYMSHVKNNRLIQAGLGEGASFLHKTGDIGKMLGDAGMVTTPNGKKYIVVILANRPYNSPEGKEFIVKASEIIYNYMVVK